MISVIIATKNSEPNLAHALAALVPAAAEGVVREVVVVDGGSTDNTDQIVDAAGGFWEFMKDTPKGLRLAQGSNLAKRSDWLLFLNPETVLESGWHHEAQAFLERVSRSRRATKTAACFRLRLADYGLRARFGETTALLGSQIFGMPHGNQGLLISKQFYKSLGGHKSLDDLEDLDIAKRIGRRRMVFLRASAQLSAADQEPPTGPSFRQSFARFCVSTLRIPTRLAIKLHG